MNEDNANRINKEREKALFKAHTQRDLRKRNEKLMFYSWSNQRRKCTELFQVP
jgi:hypothetical protein